MVGYIPLVHRLASIKRQGRYSRNSKIDSKVGQARYGRSGEDYIGDETDAEEHSGIGQLSRGSRQALTD